MKLSGLNAFNASNYKKEINFAQKQKSNNKNLLNSSTISSTPFKSLYSNGFSGNLTFNSVSFGAKFEPLPKTVEDGKNLGIEIYSEAIKPKSGCEGFNPLPLIQKAAPDLEVIPIEELAYSVDNWRDYCAFFSARMDKDYKDCDHEIFVKTSVSNDKNKALIEAMDIAHEFTHYRQSKEGQEAEFLKTLSDDWNYNAMIPTLCSIAFRKFDTELQADFLKMFFMNMQDIQNNEKYGRFLPNKRNVSKEELLKLNNYKDEKAFQDRMNRIFEKVFVETIKFVLNNPQRFDAMMNDGIVKIAQDEKLEKLCEDMRKYCSFSALKEKEAYKTECEVARGILKTRKTLNLDAFALYYEMLEEAFKNI